MFTAEDAEKNLLRPGTAGVKYLAGAGYEWLVHHSFISLGLVIIQTLSLFHQRLKRAALNNIARSWMFQHSRLGRGASRQQSR